MARRRRRPGSAPEAPSTNAVIYCRVSTKEQVQNYSLDIQEKACREWCAERGYPVVRVFREEGRSGTTSDRDALNEMIEFCEDKRNGIAFAVFHVVDRMMRNFLEHFTTKARILQAGVKVRWAGHDFGPDDNTAEVLEAMFAWQAAQFSRNLSVRTVSGMQAAVRAGRHPFPTPLGYRRERANGPRSGPSLLVDEQRAPLVRQLFEDVAWAQRSVPEAIARATAAGLRTVKGGRLAPQTAHRILTNPTYMGVVHSEKWDMEAPGDFAPIITRELFEDTQAALARAARNDPGSHRTAHPDFPLRVFVRCATCGEGLTGSFSTGRHGGKYPYYFCRKRCKAMRIRREKLDELFAELLADVQPRRAYLRLFQEIVRRVHRDRYAEVARERDQRQRRVDELEQKRMRIADDFYDPARHISRELHRDLLEKVEREIAEARSVLRGAMREEHDVSGALAFAERSLTDLPRVWRSLEPEARAKLQRAVFPDGVVFDGAAFRTPKTASVFSYLRAVASGGDEQASPAGFEPATFRLGSDCSIQLSYGDERPAYSSAHGGAQ